MAIQKTMTFSLTYLLATASIAGASSSIEENLTVDSAYIKISDIYNVRSTSATINVNIYKTDKTTLVATKTLSGFSPTATDSSANLIKQAYRWLITQNEFSDATNVLETGQTA